ncbi:MAG: tetratricopeptide repeat protein [SAR324 cluster bacterium]|nr:tetratricopeptide repeat protein [SAR324 cluster bacterium]
MKNEHAINDKMSKLSKLNNLFLGFLGSLMLLATPFLILPNSSFGQTGTPDKFSNSLDEAIDLLNDRKSNNTKKIISFLDNLIEVEPKNYQAIFIRGITLPQEFDLAKAQIDLELVVKEKPSWLALYNLAYLYVLQGKIDEPIELLTKAKKLSNSFYIYTLLAEVYRIKGQKEDHLSTMKKAIELNPKAHTPYAHLANSLYHFGDYKGSLTKINKALSIKKIAYYHFLKGLNLVALDDINKGLASLKKAVALSPELSHVYLAIGVVMINDERYQEAIDNFDEAIANGSVATGNAFKGITYYQIKKYALAKEYLQIAIDNNTNNPQVYNHLGLILYKEGDKGKAEENFAKALEINDRDPYIYADLGWFFAQNKLLTRSLSYFNQAINRVDSDDDSLLLGRGVVYHQLDENELSLIDLNKSIEIEKDNSRAYLFRAFVNDKLGNTKLAMADLAKACTLGDQLACSFK